MLEMNPHLGGDTNLMGGEWIGADPGVTIHAVDPETGVDMRGCAG